MAVREKSKPVELTIAEGGDPEETLYVQNERGAVHSVTREHWEKYLTQRSQDTGRVYPLPGWRRVEEDEARDLNPQLFGEHDPRIKFTAKELTEQFKQQQILNELYGTVKAPAPVEE